MYTTHIVTYKKPGYKFFLHFSYTFDLYTRQNQFYSQTHIVGWFDRNVDLPLAPFSFYQLNQGSYRPVSMVGEIEYPYRLQNAGF